MTTEQGMASQETENTIPIERLAQMEVRRAITNNMDELARTADAVLDKVLKGVETRDRLSVTQINGLLSLLNSSNAVAEVRRYIERQASRRQNWKKNGLDSELLKEMRGLQETEAKILSGLRNRLGRPGIDMAQVERFIKDDLVPGVHFLLVREFLQSFATGYLYQKSASEGSRQ